MKGWGGSWPKLPIDGWPLIPKGWPPGISEKDFGYKGE